MSKPQMTHRERILAAINHQPTDRVPLDYWGVGEITEKLMQHFNVKTWLDMSKAMDLDSIMGVAPNKIPSDRNGDWDVEMQRIPLPDGSGFYDEPVSHPIGKYETIDEIEANYTWPTTDMFDYSGIKAQCQTLIDEGYAISGGYISLTYFYEMIRGSEQMLLDLAADEELAEHIIYRINEFAHAHTRKIFEAADGLIDMTQVTDDFGWQQGLRISPSMIDNYFGKYYNANVALAEEFGASVFHHDDGAIMELIPWLIQKRCRILNPLQWHLPGWDLQKLKTNYGTDLCFHGGIDNQDVLPFRGQAEIKKEVETCIDILYSDKTGYILAPCHNIQACTPIENVLYMYKHAKEYGKAK